MNGTATPQFVPVTLSTAVPGGLLMPGGPMAPMTLNRACLVVSAILFVLAALLSFGLVHGGPSITGLALLAFAFWVGAGAV